MTRASVVGFLAACGLTACGGANGTLTPATGNSAYMPASTARAVLAVTSKVALVPASLDFLASGTAAAKTVTLRERGNNVYHLNKGCDTVAGFSLIEQKKNLARYSVVPQSPGACSVRFSDGKRHGATLNVTVTTTSILLNGSSVGPHAVSATVVLGSASAISAIASCSRACSISAPPSKPGSDAYGITVYDAANGTGKVLSRGSLIATILANKANVFVASPPRVAAHATFGSVPAGAGGTPFSPAALSLAVKDADYDTISGTFTPPVTIADNDTSALPQGSYLTLNGGGAVHATMATSSSAVLAIGYGGLAIAPATIVATIGSTAIGQVQFAPLLSAVAYTGTNNGNRPVPEIDLYSNISGQPGYSGAFTLTQTGWSTSPYLRPFTFVPSGTNNNCSSFSIVQTSPAPPTYSVNPIASAKPGLCTMMLTGASGSSSTPVVLTYTNPVPVHVSTRHSPSRY
jgi:hypothetical protein